jgi:hypothetical protein
MFRIAKVKKDAAPVPQPPHQVRALCLRIEQLEERIAPLCKLQDAMSPK